MAQLAIPIVLIGVAYLVSNDEERRRRKRKFHILMKRINQGSFIESK